MLFTNGELESYIISFFFFSLSEKFVHGTESIRFILLSSFISGGRQ